MKAIIMAGGKGTRVQERFGDIPKPMIRILGKPVLEYQLEVLRDSGINDVTIIVGHIGQKIVEYFGDGSIPTEHNPHGLDINIKYFVETTPLGTAGALYYIKETLDDDFLLLNGDIIFDMNLDLALHYHKSYNAVGTLVTHPNNHPYDSGIIITDDSGQVVRWLHKEEDRLWYKNIVNSGIHILSPRLFSEGSTKSLLSQGVKLDLDRDIFSKLIVDKTLYAYQTSEYIKDMGTLDRITAVENDISTGLVRSKSYSRKQKAIFLDRDGVINKYVGFLTNINDFELLDNVSEAIRIINESGYLAIVITNQPVIARGEVSFSELDDIHNKMETLLGEKGAYLDHIYFCPHHPNSGYVGEVVELKVDCNCRKPKPGLIFEAAKEYNIDLSQSWFVGDSDIDIEAGKAAGCQTAYINSKSKRYPNVQRYIDLLEFVSDNLGGSHEKSK